MEKEKLKYEYKFEEIERFYSYKSYTPIKKYLLSRQTTTKKEVIKVPIITK